MIDSTNAFGYGMAGVMSDSNMNRYAEHVRIGLSSFTSLGGWMGQQAEKTMKQFNDFMDSKLWELSSRLTGQSTEKHVGRFDIGYLGSLENQQRAVGLMREYIMANPNVMQLYQEGAITGYDGEFNPNNVGIGSENYFYRKATDGLMIGETVDGKYKLKHTDYLEMDNTDGLSFRERVNIQNTWAASNIHLLNELFDPTNPSGKGRPEKEDKEN